MTGSLLFNSMFHLEGRGFTPVKKYLKRYICCRNTSVILINPRLGDKLIVSNTDSSVLSFGQEEDNSTGFIIFLLLVVLSLVFDILTN